jgi:hypothetical protein
MNDDLPHDFIPAIDKFWGRLFSSFDGEALNARNLLRNFLTKCHLHPSDVVIVPRERERLAASLVLHLQKYEEEKSRREELETLVAELQAQLKSKRPTPEANQYDARPDKNGNVPYSAFLIALLAARNWRIQDAQLEFAQLADIEQQTVAHWCERGKVPYEYYKLIADLPFSKVRRQTFDWTPEAVEMLRRYFPADKAISNAAKKEIAKEMTRRLGRHLTGHAVHCKAGDLGLLRDRKARKRAA